MMVKLGDTSKHEYNQEFKYSDSRVDIELRVRNRIITFNFIITRHEFMRIFGFLS